MFAMAYEHVDELVESFIASSVTIQSYTNISICGEGCLLSCYIFYSIDKKI